MKTETNYRNPQNLSEALSWKRELERDIWNIERQLAEKTHFDRSSGVVLSGAAYQNWRKAAHSRLIYKKVDHSFIKDWITERRRKIDADEVGIHDPNDPRELLQRTKIAMKKAMDGDDSDLGVLCNVIDQYLHHAA